MSPDKTGRLVILSGPSCVGKSPLYKSLGKFYPELHAKLQKLVLFNSRAPRPGELDGVDYHFRTRAQVDALLLTDIMRRKLLRRTRRQKGDLSAKDLENVETRASSAYRELREAWHFQYVIPNHDGEDSDHWEAFYYLIGDARKTLDAFVALLKGSIPPGVEQWEEDLLPPMHLI